jgi:hypothetical protein
VIQQRDNSPVMMDFAFDVQIIKLWMMKKQHVLIQAVVKTK